MTSTALTNGTNGTNGARIATLPTAVMATLAAVAFTALGVFGHGDEHDIGEFLFVVGVSIIVAAAVFGLCVHRLQDSSSAAGVGLGLSIVGLLSVVVFFMGLTPPLAVGGLVLGAAARHTRRHVGLGTAAVVIGALALVGYAAIYIGDWMAANNIAGL